MAESIRGVVKLDPDTTEMIREIVREELKNASATKATG